MNDVYNDLFVNYAFHDTELTSVSFEAYKIKLFFGSGIYKTDIRGNEIDLTKPVTIEIKTAYKNIDNYVDIFLYNKRIKNTTIESFIKQLKEDVFTIDMAYYSKFGSTLLIDGGFKKENAFVSITDIESIVFCFDE